MDDGVYASNKLDRDGAAEATAGVAFVHVTHLASFNLMDHAGLPQQARAVTLSSESVAFSDDVESSGMRLLVMLTYPKTKSAQGRPLTFILSG